MTALTLAQVKAFLRYTNTDSDGPLDLMLKAGQNWVERHTSRLMTQREITESFPAFSSYHDLRWRPFVADSLTIEYLDVDFAAQTFDGFVVFGFGDGSRLVPTTSWPIGARGITLTYTAGYEAAEDVPEVMLHAVALYVAMSDEERSTLATGGANALTFLLEDLHPPVLA